MKAKAYSYIRFSSEKQKKGHSVQRQTELAQTYAKDHGMVLDTNTYKDLGVSAYTGKNSSEGGLKTFLNAVDSGVIKPGSYLLVESLDRLSRQRPISALSLLSNILERDIIVVTLRNKKEFTRDSLEDTTNLMMSIMEMGIAYEESAKKGERVGKAWEKKRQDAKDHKKPMTNKISTWMKIEGEEIVLIPERVRIIKKIFSMAIEGKGKTAITKHLNENCVENWNGSDYWHSSYIRKILSSKSAYGALDTPKLFLEDYFPKAITKAQFLKVNDIRTKRKLAPGRSSIKMTNLFTGLGRCGVCGGSMCFVNKSCASNPRSKDWRYLVCTKARLGSVDCNYESWQYSKLEKHILYSLREMNYEDLFGGDLEIDFEGEILLKEDELKETAKQIDNIVDIMVETGSKALSKKLTALETNEEILESDIQNLKDEKIIEQDKTNKADIELIDEFFKDRDNIDLRLKVHQMLRDLISEITFYPVKKRVLEDGYIFGNIGVTFSTGKKDTRLIMVFGKKQNDSGSVSNDINKEFDTMITIDDSGEVTRKKVTSNEFFEVVDESIPFVSPKEKHTLKTLDGVKYIIYPDRYKAYKKSGGELSTIMTE